jgi:hypothetical protein
MDGHSNALDGVLVLSLSSKPGLSTLVTVAQQRNWRLDVAHVCPLRNMPRLTPWRFGGPASSGAHVGAPLDAVPVGY